MRLRGRRDGQPGGGAADLATGVGHECEAFLAGRLALYLETAGRPVPPDLDPADIVRITLARLYELPELSA